MHKKTIPKDKEIIALHFRCQNVFVGKLFRKTELVIGQGFLLSGLVCLVHGDWGAPAEECDTIIRKCLFYFDPVMFIHSFFRRLCHPVLFMNLNRPKVTHWHIININLRHDKHSPFLGGILFSLLLALKVLEWKHINSRGLAHPHPHPLPRPSVK